MTGTPARLRFPAGLYGVTPDWDDADRLENAIRQAAAGGMVALQLRLKTVDRQTRIKIAHRLRKVCSDLGVIYIINDDWRLALETDAHGVHLGRDDGDPCMVRAALGSQRLLGVSCYADLERARTLLTTPVDYIAFGAMFASGTKPQAPPAPLTILSKARSLCECDSSEHPSASQQHSLPRARAAVVAIGGITPDNARHLITAGADSLAVVGALFNAQDIETVARQFSSLFENVVH